MLPFLELNFCVVLKNRNWKIYQTFSNDFPEVFFLIVFKTGSLRKPGLELTKPH